MTDAIVLEDVHKRYRGKRALDGLDLSVGRGTVHAVLGPNGAGKTTAVRILSTLLRHDEGRAEVAGFDVRSRAGEVRRRIGLPVGFLSNVFAIPESMPGWLGAVVEWNPMSATATAVRDLFGNPGGAGGSWAAEHAGLLAVVWPVALIAVFFPLAVRRFARLSH